MAKLTGDNLEQEDDYVSTSESWFKDEGYSAKRRVRNNKVTPGKGNEGDCDQQVHT